MIGVCLFFDNMDEKCIHASGRSDAARHPVPSLHRVCRENALTVRAFPSYFVSSRYCVNSGMTGL